MRSTSARWEEGDLDEAQAAYTRADRAEASGGGSAAGSRGRCGRGVSATGVQLLGYAGHHGRVAMTTVARPDHGGHVQVTATVTRLNPGAGPPEPPRDL